MHGVVILLVLFPAGRELARALGPGLADRPPGGGGGAGGAYISLPAYSAPRVPEAAPTPKPVTPPPEPPPVVPKEVPLVPVDTIRPEPMVAPDSTAARGPGDSVSQGPPGAGTGGGTGGGVGPGAGPGTGPGSGPGTGGGGVGASGVPPQSRQMIVPPVDDRPKELKGLVVDVTFWVDAQGAVQRVEMDPAIPDRKYADKFREVMKKYRFTPARSPTGAAVPGTTTITVTLY